MCYFEGSLDHATSICPMCKVFKPTASRCPHVKDVCRNHANHPRGDVMFLKNPEVPTFKGCGYCKWANNNPPPKTAGYQNPGWPGCCRSPKDDEKRLIPPADWMAVNFIHHVPIPPEIKAILDSLPHFPGKPPSLAPTSPAIKSSSAHGSPQAIAATATPQKPSSSPRAAPMAIPSKGRSGGSPQQAAALLSATRDTFKGSKPSSAPKNQTLDDHLAPRRSMEQPSPNRKHAELGGTLPRRGSIQKAPANIASLSAAFGSAAISDSIRPSLSRRASTANTKAQAVAHPPPEAVAATTTRSRRRSMSSEDNPAPLLVPVKTSVPAAKSLSSASSSGSSSASSGSGSMSDNTITSEGFTDYLSDESEAEIQRQAEIKAAQLAQNAMEEQEFNLARRQLVKVNLQPPKSWNPASATARASTTSTHGATYPSHAAYTSSNYMATAPSRVDVAYGRAK